MQIGIGQGAGEYVEVMDKEAIIKIIEDTKDKDIVRIAKENQIVGFKNGYCAIDLEDGEIMGFGLSNGESNHACDNNYVVLYKIDSNDEDYCCPDHGCNITYFLDNLAEEFGDYPEELEDDYTKIVEWYSDNFDGYEEFYNYDYDCYLAEIEVDKDSVIEELESRYADTIEEEGE